MVYFAYICLFLLLISKRHMCNNQFINLLIDFEFTGYECVYIPVHYDITI